MTTISARGTEAFPFSGAKAAFFQGTRLLTNLRDDLPGLPWPGHWDLPGGGREGFETAEACLLRELAEEFGLYLSPARLEQRIYYPAAGDVTLQTVFFAGRITEAEIASIRFGSEGQCWQMMEVAEFLAHPKGVPAFQARVRAVAARYL